MQAFGCILLESFVVFLIADVKPLFFLPIRGAGRRSLVEFCLLLLPQYGEGYGLSSHLPSPPLPA
jgi:hypothetical protein